jgi:hypothetical protein
MSTAREIEEAIRTLPAGLHLERLCSDRRAWSVRIMRDYRAVTLSSREEWVWIWIGEHKDFDRGFPA